MSPVVKIILLLFAKILVLQSVICSHSLHSSDTTHLTHLTTLSETHLPATPPPSPQVHSFMLLTLYVIQPCLFARFFCEVGSIMLQQPSCVSFMLQNCFPNFLFIFYTKFVFPLIIAFPLFFSLLTLNCLFIILC